MAKRKIQITAVDDDQHVAMDIQTWRLIGNTWVSEEPPFRVNLLSFPGASWEDWKRDMAVLAVERL